MCNYSEIALKTLAAKVLENPTNKQFYTKYSDEKTLSSNYDNNQTKKITESFLEKFNSFGLDGFICDKDEDFPKISDATSLSDKPYLLFFKGDLNLLKNLNNNVAVIGLRDIDYDIEKRETGIVESLVDKGLNIVSGLAEGCDSVAHKTTLNNGGKTVAILPSTVQNIIPKNNFKLANEIVDNGGLLISEYFDEPKDQYDALRRFVDRDRLQAMFSKSVVLIASYEKGKGDSGSRHAMNKAKKYGLKRCVMYNEGTDKSNLKFGLNKKYLENNPDVDVFKMSSAKEIYEYCIVSLNSQHNNLRQLSFDFK